MGAFSLGQRGHLASASSPCQHILRPRQPVCCYWIFSSYHTQDTLHAIHTNNLNLTSAISALLLPIWCPVYAKGPSYINFTDFLSNSLVPREEGSIQMKEVALSTSGK